MRKRTFLFLLLVFTTACSVPVQKTPEMFWPAPPEKPRIKYIGEITSGSTLLGDSPQDLKDYVLGDYSGAVFSKPVFAAVKSGVLYVTDLFGMHIYNFKTNTYTHISGYLRTPSGVAVSSDGTVFVGDSTRKTIFKFNSQGQEIGYFGFINSPGGLAVDNARKRLLAVDASADEVYVYDFSGKLQFKFGGKGNGPGQFNFPYSVAVDRQGNIIVLDSGNFRVQIFDKNGCFIRAFGGIGTVPGDFMRPKGVALDPDGHIYVTDSAFGNFQIFDELGNLYLFVGENGTGPGQLQLPFGIAIDENGRIYVVDQMNRRVQIFQYLESGASNIRPKSSAQ